MTNLTGRTLGQYQIHEQIGQGGMATVYRATQTNIGRDVAIKVLPVQFMMDRTFLERFNREVQTIAKVQHRCILPVYDFGEQDGVPFIVMAYMEGGSLSDRIQSGGPMPLDETTRIVAQIADGLNYAHLKGIIHRDFKPSNVLLDDQDNAYLADFGIAKVAETTVQLTGSGMAVGTPAYMAPEMYRQGDLTPAVDVYALGVTLYLMLTGQYPFKGDTPIQYMRAHLDDPVPILRAVRSDLPVTVQPVLDRSLAKDPGQRYQQTTAFAADLSQAATPGETTPAPTPTPQPDLGEPTIPMDEPVAQPEMPPRDLEAPTMDVPETPTQDPVLALPSVPAPAAEDQYETLPPPPEESSLPLSAKDWAVILIGSLIIAGLGAMLGWAFASITGAIVGAIVSGGAFFFVLHNVLKSDG
jgi:serine/threonine-protein kinase